MGKSITQEEFYERINKTKEIEKDLMISDMTEEEFYLYMCAIENRRQVEQELLK